MYAQMVFDFEKMPVDNSAATEHAQNTDSVKCKANPPAISSTSACRQSKPGTASVTFLKVTKEYAVNWVKENIMIIRGRAARFLPYSPYELGDLQQEAYVSALEALPVCNDPNKRVPFPAAFWKIYNHNLSRMATNPSLKKVLGEEASKAPAYFLSYEDITAERHKYGSSEDDECPTIPAYSHFNFSSDQVPLSESAEQIFLQHCEEARKLQQIREMMAEAMTERQQEVWGYLLDSCCTPSETARIMNVSKQTVTIIRNQGLKRLINHFQKNQPALHASLSVQVHSFPLLLQKKIRRRKIQSDCPSIT